MPIPCCDTIIIRPFVEGDVAAVAVLEHQSLSPWSAALVAEELSGSLRLGVVAELDGQVVGWCCGRFCRDEGELLKVAVDRQYRRRGIATRLLRDWEARLSRKGVAAFFLEVRLHNRAAIELYAHAGYAVVGTRPTYYQDPEDDALIMSKAIGQGGKR